MSIAITTHLLFLFSINIPFGMWRGAVRKLSLQWFLAIHVPVIFSILLRKKLGLEVAPWYILISLAIFFISQRIGVYLYQKRRVNVEQVSVE